MSSTANGARVSGAPEAGVPAGGTSAETAWMAGAAPDNNAGVPAPRCPGAQRPGIGGTEARGHRVASGALLGPICSLQHRSQLR